MRAVVKKWGNSAAVRVPAAVMAEARLRLDQPVEIRAEDGRVVIEGVGDPEYRLEDLVAQITPENRHQESDFGPPVGRERL
jgi:antitoxin MazE